MFFRGFFLPMLCAEVNSDATEGFMGIWKMRRMRKEEEEEAEKKEEEKADDWFHGDSCVCTNLFLYFNFTLESGIGDSALFQ